MITDKITIANLSCNGCVRTITKKLSAFNAVEDVAVDLETNIVTVSHDEMLSRDQISETLRSLGYPEASEENGLRTQLKSITSCMSGKFSN